jgi:hypothetical protein
MIWILLGVLVVLLAGVLVFVGQRSTNDDEVDPLEARLAEYSARGEVV